MSRHNRKALTAVVATALLIVVTVMTVIGFQTWFGSFSSSVLVNTEQNSNQANTNTNIETLVGDTLYFKNSLEDNLTVKEIKINNIKCNISSFNLSLGVKDIDLKNCTDNLTTNVADIVIITEKKVFEKKIYINKRIVKEESGFPTALPAIDGSFVETFTGPDGSEPNPNYWEVINNISGSEHRIENNKLFINSVNSQYVRSKFKLKGDFDIQIDYEIITGPDINSWGVSLLGYIDGNNWAQIARTRCGTGGGNNQWISFYKTISGTWSNPNWVYNNGVTGQLRIVRVGSSADVFYLDSGWQKLSSSPANIGTGDIRIRFNNGDWDADPLAENYFDNLKINSYDGIEWA